MNQQPIHKTFAESAYSDNREIIIYLPKDYDTDANSKYHVMYVFDAQLPELLPLINAVQYYLNGYGYPSFIIVGIQTTNRPWVFTPVPIHDANAGSRWGNGQKVGGAGMLRQFLQEEVMPFIDTHFRTKRFNVAIGHSLSATFITWCMLTTPGLFNAYFAFSPNYHYDREQLVHLFKEKAGELDHYRLFYLAYGKESEDELENLFRPATKQVRDFLQNDPPRQLMWQVDEIDSFASHGTTPLMGMIKGLEFFFSQLTFNNTVSIAANPGQLRQFYANHLTNWYGYPIIPAANELNNLAYKCLGNKDPVAALAALDWAISLYPDDYNLYDSRGEMKENLQQYAPALEDYRKAKALAEDQNRAGNMKEKEFENALHWVQQRLQQAEKLVNELL